MSVFGEEWKVFKQSINSRFEEQSWALIRKDEEIAELKAQIEELKSKKKCKVGIYNGNGRDAEFSDVPFNLATTYYNVGNVIPNKYDKERVANNVTPMLGLATKNYNGLGANSFMSWVDIADGFHDDYLANLGQRLDSLQHEVWLSLDIEPDVKLNQNYVPSNWKPEDFGRAFARMVKIVREVAPNVSFTYWVGGHQKELVTRMYPGDEWIDRIGYDPYVTAHGNPKQTALQCWGDFVDWHRAQSWGRGKSLCITETGFHNGHSDDDQARFWKSAPVAVETLELESVTLFHRDSGPNGDYTMHNRPKGRAAYVQAMQEIAEM